MPELSRFYGIVIKMYYNDHNPPHFHAEYNGDQMVVDANTLAVIGGRLSPRRDWTSYGMGGTAPTGITGCLATGEEYGTARSHRSIAMRLIRGATCRKSHTRVQDSNVESLITAKLAIIEKFKLTIRRLQSAANNSMHFSLDSKPCSREFWRIPRRE